MSIYTATHSAVNKLLGPLSLIKTTIPENISNYFYMVHGIRIEGYIVKVDLPYNDLYVVMDKTLNTDLMFKESILIDDKFANVILMSVVIEDIRIQKLFDILESIYSTAFAQLKTSGISENAITTIEIAPYILAFKSLIACHIGFSYEDQLKSNNNTDIAYIHLIRIIRNSISIDIDDLLIKGGLIVVIDDVYRLSK